MPSIRDNRSGDVFPIDPRAARMARLRRRVAAWSETLRAWRDLRGVETVLKMATLTYAPGIEWRPNHIREFMYRVRGHLGARLVGYCWVSELQARGAVHYHVMLCHTKGRGIPQPDKAGWWKHGSTRIEKARSEFYALKYTQKGGHEGIDYPTGARLFACWLQADCEITGKEYRAFRLAVHPKWLRDFVGDNVGWRDVRRWSGGGWRIGSELFNSPYSYLPE